MVLELNVELHQFLQQRFPDTDVVCGDARELGDIVVKHRFAENAEIDAVISGSDSTVPVMSRMAYSRRSAGARSGPAPMIATPASRRQRWVVATSTTPQ